jgi:hypothetical protein
VLVARFFILMDISKLKDDQLVQLVNNRWKSSESLWTIVERVYKRNTKYYDSEMDDAERTPDYILKTPVKKFKVRANRIFTDTEAVINSLIANPPKPNLIPGRDTPESVELASLQEQYFVKKYADLNIKEVKRKALRNLYFGRLAVIKPFWNSNINDFDAVALDPRKVRFAKRSTKETESEFAIEEVDDTLESVIAKFPAKKKEILDKNGIVEDEVSIKNPEIHYFEAHIKDWVIFKYEEIILGKIKNPYWDWDGILITEEEERQLQDPGTLPQARKDLMSTIRGEQSDRQPQSAPEIPDLAQTPNQTEAQQYRAFRFNHFDVPRKPYIFATILNNENTPIGRTDFISQASTLQEGIDRRKRQFDDNAEMMNGITKVDSQVMSKADAQKLRYETSGIIWGKGVATGVQREAGVALPNFLMEDMKDSRDEIDNIMAATSAFRGEREGSETKAGRLAMIEQSALRLNELVQVNDYLDYELFNWFYQLAKVRYTETHYAKTMGDGNAVRIIELMQDDFEDGTEVKVIAGKTLPEDKEFKYQRAQTDIEKGIISPIDYFKEAGYNNPTETAKNAELYKLNPLKASGVTDEEVAEYAPPQQKQIEEPSQSMSFKDLPPDGQMQLAAKAGIELDPAALVAQQEHQQTLEIEKARKPVNTGPPAKK